MKRILVLGRFQPPHIGHMSILEAAAKRCDQLLVVVGSAQASYTPENPFTAGERIEMLHAALAKRGVTNALLIPIIDLNRHAEWVAHVESLVPSFDEVVSNNPLTHELFGGAGYKVKNAPWVRRKEASGTNLRKRLASGQSIEGLVDPAVDKILKRLRAGRRLARLGENP